MLISQDLKDRLAKDEENGLESIRQLRLLANTWDDLSLADKMQRLEDAQLEVKVGPDKIRLSADPEGIIERRIHPLTRPGKQKKPNPIIRTFSASLYVSHGEKKIVEPDDQTQQKERDEQREQLLRRIAQGRAWAQELIEGMADSMKSLALREKKNESYIYDVMRAGCLSPAVVDQIRDQRGPLINLDDLMVPIPVGWDGHLQLSENAKT